MATPLVTVFGGTGFLGRQIVARLLADGTDVRIAVRRPDRSPGVVPPETPDAISFVRADVTDEATVAAALAGSTAAVNAVAAYVEKDGVSFDAVHESGATHVARAATEAGVRRLVHISGIGADPESLSRYIRSRGRGESLVQEAFPKAIILRPSVMFGSQDAFFNSLAKVARSSPVFPLIGGGGTLLQPVFVEDVADAVGRALSAAGTDGRIYELGGPRVYTLKALVELVCEAMGQHRFLLPVPFTVAEFQARIAERLAAPPLTLSQVELLKQDNVVDGSVPGFDDLGLIPASVEQVLPTYIRRDR